MPAQWVPCPLWSMVLVSCGTKLWPARMLGAKHGCRSSMPVSRIATLMPLPRVMSQAWGALTWLMPLGTVSTMTLGWPSNSSSGWTVPKARIGASSSTEAMSLLFLSACSSFSVTVAVTMGAS